jgi:hypothetical protein
VYAKEPSPCVLKRIGERRVDDVEAGGIVAIAEHDRHIGSNHFDSGGALFIGGSTNALPWIACPGREEHHSHQRQQRQGAAREQLTNGKILHRILGKATG